MSGLLVSDSRRFKAVTNVNTTTRDLVTFTSLAAGILNVKDRKLVIEVNGRFLLTGSQEPVLNFSVKPFTFNSDDFLRTGQLALNAGEGAFRLRFDFVTNELGASGNLTRTGVMLIELNGNAVPGDVTNYLVQFGNATDNIDLTDSITPIVQVRSLITDSGTIEAIDASCYVYDTEG